MVEDVAHRPLFPHDHVVGSHQPPDAPLAIVEEPAGDVALLGIEEIDQSLRLLAGQLGQQRRAIVGRHLVEDLGRFRFVQGVQDLALGGQVQVFERLGGRGRLQHAKDPDSLVGLEIPDQLAQVGREPAIDDLAEDRIIARFDQLADFG